MKEAAPTVLVAIPNYIPNVVAWLTDWSAQQREAGWRVLVLDAARFAARYQGKLGWSRLQVDYGSWTPSPTVAIRRTCEILELEYVKPAETRLLIDREIGLICDTAIRSTYSRMFGGGDIQLSHLPSSVVARERQAFRDTYAGVVSVLRADPTIAKVVTANGRFTVDAAVLAAAKDSGRETSALERAPRSLGAYVEYRNTVHSVLEWQRQIAAAWSDVMSSPESLLACNELAEEYLQTRLGADWEFRNEMQEGSLPKALHRGAFVAFFPTSDWEFSPFEDEPAADSFPSQDEAFEALARLCAEQSIPIVVRGHPQPGEPAAAASENSRWQLRCERVGATYIPCESNIDSNALALRSRWAATFASSIGAEIAWQGHPVALLSTTTYSSLVPELLATNADQLRAFAAAPVRTNPRKLIPWGYFMAAGGQDPKYFDVISNSRVTFRGRDFVRPRDNVFALRHLFRQWRHAAQSRRRRAALDAELDVGFKFKVEGTSD